MSSERKNKSPRSRKPSTRIKNKVDKQAQLRELSKEHYSILHGVIESANALIFSLDVKYRYLNFNTDHAKVMKAIYGAKIEIGKSILGYMSVKADRKKAKANLDRALAGEQFVEESYSGEEILSKRYFQVSHGPIKTEKGKIIGVVVISQDITERKRSEEALSESEERYRQLVELSPDAIYVHSEGKIVFANPASFKLIRAKKESDLIGKTAMDFVHPDYYQGAVERIKKAMSEGAVAPLLQEKFIRVDGTTIDVEVIAKPLKYAGKPAMQVIARDITERKLTEETFRMQLVFSQALNRISETIAKFDNADLLLQNTNNIIGETLGVDRCLIYDIVLGTNLAIALCEWLNPSVPDILPTKATYNLDLFKDGSRFMFRTHQFIESHLNKVNKNFLKDGSGKTLHEGMQIQSLLWYPFDFSSNHYYVLVFNQVSRFREWKHDEKEFIKSVAQQISIALQKIRYLAGRKEAEEALKERERHSQSLLQLSKNLERSQNYLEIINFALAEVKNIIGYQNLWVYRFTNDKKYADVMMADGYMSKAIMTSGNVARLKIIGDLMLEEIAEAKNTVIVEDARTDERTDKAIVEQLGNRTIVNVPVILLDKHLGTIGTGTFGNEGVRIPTELELEFLSAMASHIAVAFDRVQLLEEKQKVLKALQESEERYRSLFTTMEEGVAINELVFNDEGEVINYVVVDINPAFLKNSPYRTEQIIGKRATEIYSMDLEVIRNWWKEHIQKKESVHTEYYHARNNRWYFVTTTVPEGNRFATIFVDITERKRADNAILESERRFKDLANLLPQSIFEADKNGVITFANDAALTTFGYTLEDLSNGRNMTEMVSNKNKNIATENMRLILEERTVSINEYEMVRKNGTMFPALTFTGPIIYNGMPVGFRGSIVDLTQHKQAEVELRKLSEAVSQSPASIIITDLNGEIEYVNKTFEEITGYTLDEVRHKNPKFLQSGNTPIGEYKSLWEKLLSGKTWHGEFANKKKNGELYWEDVLISPVKDAKGNPINYLAVKQDVTEKKKMIEDLVAAKEEAEKANRLKSEFLAQMSHEIRSPLNVVMSMSSIIKEDLSARLTENQLRFFDGIESAGQRIIRTVDLILDVSELHVGTYKPEFKEIDLAKDVLEVIKKEYLKRATEKKLCLYVTYNTESTFVVADHYSLNQIFVNLIDNAIKYTNQGAVTVSVGKNANDRICVCVEDTGIGISHEYMEMIFEPFTQEDRGYSRRFEGNGLGLALVKRYCDLNEVEIAVESEKGKGSKFTVTFPQK